MRDVEKYKNLPVERQLLLYLAKRSRLTYKNYINTLNTDPDDRVNLIMNMILWNNARNTYLTAKQIVINHNRRGE